MTTSNEHSSFPTQGLAAVLGAALVSAALLLNPHGVDAQASSAPSASAAVLVTAAPAPLSDDVDWSRVSVAPATPGASVGAYD